jgi:predicted PurR-regulated permease PerM
MTVEARELTAKEMSGTIAKKVLLCIYTSIVGALVLWALKVALPGF